MPNVAQKRADKGDRVGDLLGDLVKAKETADLVFAVTGYVGSGLSFVAAALDEQLQEAGFTTSVIPLSNLLADHAGRSRSHTKTIADVTPLQDTGDSLRKQHGSSIVAGLGIQRIRELRSSLDEPRAFILDSIKHPKEVEVLRAVYGRGFYLLGVLCNRDVRLERLKLKFKSEREPVRIEEMMERDEAGREAHGQQVRKTLHLSDFFVANERQDKQGANETLGDALERFVQAITGSQVIRPNSDEKGMHAAWSASLRSSCMSRQVGASIANSEGEILATGTNDPPAPGGGLYSESSTVDRRCFKWSGDRAQPYCRNDHKKREIYGQILAGLDNLGVLKPGVTEAQIGQALRHTRVRNLIEFSRAIHAEMDALLSITRSGVGLRTGATLYCTTYPCHSCARHIVAAGLVRVVYLEPYAKSLALELHADAIREISVVSGPDPGSRITLQLFTGVAPRRFSALFEKRRKLKTDTGELVTLKTSAAHADPVLKRSFLQLEEELAGKVKAALELPASDEQV